MSSTKGVDFFERPGLIDTKRLAEELAEGIMVAMLNLHDDDGKKLPFTILPEVALRTAHSLLMQPHENPAGAVKGYTAQPDAKVALVNGFKEDEERLLRKLDALKDSMSNDSDINAIVLKADQRWLAVARTDLQRGFMALNRAVFQPQRITLPEDGE